MNQQLAILGMTTLFLCGVTAVHADQIQLKSGKNIECKILSQNRIQLSCRDRGGKTLRFKKKDIRRIRFGSMQDPPAAKKAQKKREAARKKAAERRRKEARKQAAARKRIETRKQVEASKTIEARKRIKARKQVEANKNIKSPGQVEAEKKNEAARQKPAPAKPKETEPGAEKKIETTKKPKPKPKPPQARSKSPRTAGGAAWRSAVLPGWGQRYQGDQERGQIFGGGFLAGAGLMLALRLQFDQARADYESSVATGYILESFGDGLGLAQWLVAIPPQRETMITTGTNFNRVSVLVTLFYLYNIVDAYLFSSEPVSQPATRIDFFLTSENGPSPGGQSPLATERLAIQYTLRF